MPNYGGLQTNTNRNETSFGIPLGAVIAWTAPLGTTVPTGYLLCDGAAYLQSAYPYLYIQIQQTHGNGTKNANGSSSGLVGLAFNLPDYRGVFHRGHNGGSTTDWGTRTAQNVGGTPSGVGTFESHAIQGHWHVVYGTIRAARYATIPPPTYFYSNAGPPSPTFYGGQGRAVLTGANGGVRVGRESRGHNVSATYLIRAF